MEWFLILVLAVCFICTRAARAEQLYESLLKREQAADIFIREIQSAARLPERSERSEKNNKPEAWLFDLGF